MEEKRRVSSLFSPLWDFSSFYCLHLVWQFQDCLAPLGLFSCHIFCFILLLYADWLKQRKPLCQRVILLWRRKYISRVLSCPHEKMDYFCTESKLPQLSDVLSQFLHLHDFLRLIDLSQMGQSHTPLCTFGGGRWGGRGKPMGSQSGHWAEVRFLRAGRSWAELTGPKC